MKIELRRYWAVLLVLALALPSLSVRADVNPAPPSRDWRTPADFSAKCDVRVLTGSASWAAGGTQFTPNNGITPTSADIGKKLVVYGAGSGGNTYVGSITGVSGGAWTVSPALSQGSAASGLNSVYGISSITASQSGSGSYAPGDTITAAGGTITGGSNAVFTVKYTKVQSATVSAGGSGGTNGTQTVTGTTGRGQWFQASVTVAGGAITAVLSITIGGAYSTNPTALAAEPVTGAGLTGATLNLKMGVAQVLITNPGGYVSPGATFALTQGSTSGSGTGFAITAVASNTGMPGHYGQWYYGTDDGNAFAGAATWAVANRGRIVVPPAASCGTSQTISLTSSLASIEGDASGYVVDAPQGQSLNSALYWMGAAGSPMILIKTPDAGTAIAGNSVKRLELIGGNRAGYGVQVKTLRTGSFEDLYFQQFTNAGFELGTNTNVVGSDTQRNLGTKLFFDQVGSNGVMMRWTGDPSVNLGDSGGNDFYRIDGNQGLDTGLEIGYASTNTLKGGAWAPVYSSALYSIDMGCATTRCTYGNRIEYFNGGGVTNVIARGSDSTGDNTIYSRQDEILYGGDGQLDPIIGVNAQLNFRDINLKNNQLLTTQLLTGLTATANRQLINGSTSGVLLGSDVSFSNAGSSIIGANLKYDNVFGYECLSTGKSEFIVFNGTSGTITMGTGGSCTAGNTTSLTTQLTLTQGGGVQVGAPAVGDQGAGTLSVQGNIYSGVGIQLPSTGTSTIGFGAGAVGNLVISKNGLATVLDFNATNSNAWTSNADLFLAAGKRVTTPNLTVGGVAGVSCTVGTLTPATAVITGGIVTHC